MKDNVRKWVDEHATENRFGTKEYPAFICHVANLFDDRSHDDTCECRWITPYGFVPEAGCEKHDR